MNQKHGGFKDGSKSNTVHNRAMLFYLGVNKFTPTDAVLGESSTDRRILCTVNYGNKICSAEISRLIDICIAHFKLTPGARKER